MSRISGQVICPTARFCECGDISASTKRHRQRGETDVGVEDHGQRGEGRESDQREDLVRTRMTGRCLRRIVDQKAIGITLSFVFPLGEGLPLGVAICSCSALRGGHGDVTRGSQRGIVAIVWTPITGAAFHQFAAAQDDKQTRSTPARLTVKLAKKTMI